MKINELKKKQINLKNKKLSKLLLVQPILLKKGLRRYKTRWPVKVYKDTTKRKKYFMAFHNYFDRKQPVSILTV